MSHIVAELFDGLPSPKSFNYFLVEYYLNNFELSGNAW